MILLVSPQMLLKGTLAMFNFGLNPWVEWFLAAMLISGYIGFRCGFLCCFLSGAMEYRGVRHVIFGALAIGAMAVVYIRIDSGYWPAMLAAAIWSFFAGIVLATTSFLQPMD